MSISKLPLQVGVGGDWHSATAVYVCAGSLDLAIIQLDRVITGLQPMQLTTESMVRCLANTSNEWQ